MRPRRAGEPGGYLFGKLYARSHLRADRWYKLGRQLRYGRLEDERSFQGVRRLTLRGTSAITPDNDRAGRGALQLTLTGHCAVGRAAAVRTTEPGISRLRALGGGPGSGATWYDVFPGGVAARPGGALCGATAAELGPSAASGGTVRLNRARAGQAGWPRCTRKNHGALTRR